MGRCRRHLWSTRALASVLFGLVVVLSACASGATPPGGVQTTPPGTTVSGPNPTPGQVSGPLHVKGAQIVDATGQPVLLRGAMIPSAFAYIKRWQNGQDPTQMQFTPATFAAMASWHMNTVRINVSYWIYQLNPSLYMSRLDQTVQRAHSAGLFVVLDYHDDAQSGNPSPDGLMHQESITFWTILASHYRNDPTMLFDPINEPKYADWQTWLNGNSSGVVGYQQLIQAIRATGAQQIIVLEPGAGCTCGHAAWGGVDNYLPSDPNIIFSMHDYAEVVQGNPSSWDAGWGPILGRYPIYYGEWAVLPHANYPVFCKGVTSSNADSVTNAFLNYMQARQANWTAWDFAPTEMLQDYTSYSPTTFSSGAPWSCEDTSAAQAGMGSVVMQFLASHPAAKARS